RNFVFKSAAQKAWMEVCAAKGYTVPDWPVAYGGAGMNPAEAKVWREEMARAGARPPLSSFGIWMLGPALLKFGTEEQKVHYLGQVARGEIRWCQGYSEPGSGSDLVSLQTYGDDKGDHWVVNGQKIWTSYADKADWIFCLVRTDKTNVYQGISFLLFDMTTPGVTTKPIKLISGASPFCETFFDNVVVPKTQIVGQLNRGWDVAKYLLGHEREMISGAGGGEQTSTIGKVLARGGLDDPMLRAELAAFDIDALAFAAMGEKFLDEIKVGKAHPAQPNMMKYAGTELNKRRHELLMAVGGSTALEWESEATRGGAPSRSWLRTKANSIEGGTSEVMLNVVAKRILELPGA
ncbi:MAG: acyl-CoA dehydrogenase family protein, partial [Novosphingobium sp.]|nr:acyl-CoA dehydrogenase family protein [Novosphingobium sp.]